MIFYFSQTESMPVKATQQQNVTNIDSIQSENIKRAKTSCNNYNQPQSSPHRDDQLTLSRLLQPMEKPINTAVRYQLYNFDNVHKAYCRNIFKKIAFA